MMIERLEFGVCIAQVLICAALLAWIWRFERRHPMTAPCVWIGAACLCCLIGDIFWALYEIWIADDLHRHFSASDISYIGMYLLLGTAAALLARERDGKPGWFTWLWLLFGAFNIFAWIWWTGMILVDLLWGVSILRLSFFAVRLLERRMRGAEKAAVAAALAAIALVWCLTNFVPALSGAATPAVNAVWTAGALLMAALTVQSERRHRDGRAWLLLYIFIEYAAFLTDGIPYSVFDLLGTLIFAAGAVLLLRKEAEA